MKQFNLSSLRSLTWANIKMFARDKGALFWSLFFPVIIISIFGVLDFANGGKTNIGMVYDETTKQVAEPIKDSYESNDGFTVTTGDLKTELNELENDKRTLVIEFKVNPETHKTEIISYLNKVKEQSANFLFLATENSLNKMALGMSKIDSPFVIESKTINVHELRNIDYMVPGVIALAIMQGGLFGVVGTIVNYRERGILKRLFATPLSKGDFIVSLILSRLVLTMIQVILLLLFAFLIFQIKIVGALWLVALLSILGGLVFLAMGFLFSGLAKSTETARALTAPIQMILMFTGGVYFDREFLPKWLFDITAYSPLTYLSDALRDVMVRGSVITDSTIKTASVGLFVALLVLIGIAIKTFKWEKA